MNQLQTFAYNGFCIDFELIDGHVYANATAMCKPFGKTVYEWSRLPTTLRYVEALKANRENPVTLTISRKGGLTGGCTLIHEKLILKLAQWLDVDFEIWCDEKIAELLRTGKTQIAPTLPSKKELAQWFLAAEAEKERLSAELAEAQQVIEEQAPKVQFVDEVLSSVSTWTTSTIANELGMSAIALNKRLEELGIQYNRDGHWLLTSRYQNKGLASTRTHGFKRTNGKVQTNIYTVWTEKGRAFIHSKLNPALQLPTPTTVQMVGIGQPGHA